ncbi:MAG: hypothetical protein GX657_17195 [Chloroflexi bacterium]|jgi:hypothetical protein|nr:hypothetical protein [Chloroflexota bacterium]
MALFSAAWWTELAIQLLVAALTTLLGMLTYDRAVARPRAKALREQVRRLADRP